MTASLKSVTIPHSSIIPAVDPKQSQILPTRRSRGKYRNCNRNVCTYKCGDK